jgi:hypothetical protein
MAFLPTIRSKVMCLFVIGQPLFETASLLADGTYNPFPTFDFTGPLRPVYPLSPTRTVPSHIPRPDYADNGKYDSGFVSRFVR